MRSRFGFGSVRKFRVRSIYRSDIKILITALLTINKYNCDCEFFISRHNLTNLFIGALKALPSEGVFPSGPPPSLPSRPATLVSG